MKKKKKKIQQSHVNISGFLKFKFILIPYEKKTIFQQSNINISGFLKFKFVKFYNVNLPLHLFPVAIFYIYLQRDLQNLIIVH